jgi:ATP-dependent DNA helicase RecG
MNLPITKLKGVGEQLAAKLSQLGIYSLDDVLFHLPMRYQNRTQIRPIRELKAGDQAVVEGVIEAAEVRVRKKRMLLCMLNDETGVIMLRFFHFSEAQRKQLQPGTPLRCFGEVRDGYDCLEIVHPEYRQVNPDNPPEMSNELTPVYPATEGVNQNLLRKLTDQALEYDMEELLPLALRQQFKLAEINQALRIVHRPPPDVEMAMLLDGKHPAQRRLAFEELLAQHLSLRVLRLKAEKKVAPTLTPLPEGEGLNQEESFRTQLLTNLPFQLTAAQQRVLKEIEADLSQPHPMQRLVQGDVGSGKTIVAALAALQAVEAGYQVAVMAPTELLAEQHFRAFSNWLTPLNLTSAWLTGSLTKKQRTTALEHIESGAAHVAVGTHALFQESVQFANLGLIIVDEQHRFGVHQRLALRDKGSVDNLQPHQLIMTATPIPRTLAMTAYADLDVSIIDELPPGRSPVVTVVIPDTRRTEVIQRVANACTERRQAYWVCPLIEESEALQCQAAEVTAEQLREQLPQVRIGLVHGRMKAKDKDTVMQAFKAGELDLLVATTVIEVGVDVPNASLMIIENAERMGLAQLHQLRGRVGRGATQSFCVLLYKHPLSQTGKARLGILRDSQDGFYIAERDLEIRGPGEVLGTKQTGVAALRIADLERDQDLLPLVGQAANQLAQTAPEQIAPLLQRWLKDGLAYGDVF